jgi:hypothetical protein
LTTTPSPHPSDISPSHSGGISGAVPETGSVEQVPLVGNSSPSAPSTNSSNGHKNDNGKGSLLGGVSKILGGIFG